MQITAISMNTDNITVKKCDAMIDIFSPLSPLFRLPDSETIDMDCNCDKIYDSKVSIKRKIEW